MSERRIPPLIASAILILAAMVAGFWGYASSDAEAMRVAHITRTQARLNDGACTFAADVMLRSRLHQWAFQRKQREVRDALIEILRTKSRYMVSNPVAREALRAQMLREVNRVIDAPVADRFDFTEFVLS